MQPGARQLLCSGAINCPSPVVHAEQLVGRISVGVRRDEKTPVSAAHFGNREPDADCFAQYLCTAPGLPHLIFHPCSNRSTSEGGSAPTR